MYRIGIEEQSGKFYGVIVDESDSILHQILGKEIDDFMEKLFNAVQLTEDNIEYVALSTDSVDRAFTQLKSFSPIAMIRIGPSESNFSYKLNENNFRYRKGPVINNFFVKGAVNLSGEENLPLDSGKIGEIGKFLNDNEKIKAIGILGLFSNFFSQQEEKAAEELRRVLKRNLPICLSSMVSHRSLVYRESLLISNLMLINYVSQHLSKIIDKLTSHVRNVNIYFLKFDGSLISASAAMRYPVLLKDATHVSKTVGAISSTKLKSICLFSRAGPKTVMTSSYEARPIVRKIRNRVQKEFNSFSYCASKFLDNNFEEINALVKNIHKNGRSSILIDKAMLSRFPKWEELSILPLRVDGYLGALGAATAPIRLSTDFLGSIQFQGRKEVLEKAKIQAEERIIQEGANASSVRVVQIDEIPISYLPWYTLRIKISIEGKPRKAGSL